MRQSCGYFTFSQRRLVEADTWPLRCAQQDKG